MATSTPCFYTHMFVVPKAAGGFRPIIDLYILNKYVITTKFKMEAAKAVMSAIKQDNWIVSLDVKEAFLQVPIHLDS